MAQCTDAEELEIDDSGSDCNDQSASDLKDQKVIEKQDNHLQLNHADSEEDLIRLMPRMNGF